ncbi:hypothetical protein [Roseomonas sp. WA12]
MTRKRTPGRPHFRRRTSGTTDSRQLRLSLRHGRGGRRKRSQAGAQALTPYPALLLHRTVIPFGNLPTKPPVGMAWLYQMSGLNDPEPFYAGFTSQNPATRLAAHVSFARHREGSNIRLETRLRRMAEQGETLVMRLVGMHPIHAIGAAEVALVAGLRTCLGTALLNQGPGGESAPVGRLVSREERYRAAMARRARQADPAYRLHQALASARPRHTPEALNHLLTDIAEADPSLPTCALCRRHGVHEAVLLGLLAGTARHLVVDPERLAAARAAQARRQAVRSAAEEATASAVIATLLNYLAAPAGMGLAEIARIRGLDPRRLQESIRRRRHGISDELAGAVRARMREDNRLRGAALGRKAPAADARLLRWWLTAYSRPGSTLTLATVAARLGVTQGALSHRLAGERGTPLPRALLRACRARARTARLAALRSGMRR